MSQVKMCFTIYSPACSNIKGIFSMEIIHSNKSGNKLCCVGFMYTKHATLKQSCGNVSKDQV